MIVAFILAIAIVLSVQFSPQKFDFRDILIDNLTGKVSLTKFANLTALLVSSWGFTSLVVDSKLTEWYFTAYMITWSGSSLLSKWIGSIKPLDAPKESK